MSDMETELMVRARKGDGKAFGLLIRGYLTRVYRTALLFVHNSEDAADICQEVLIRAYRAFPRFDPARPLYPWLYRITRNVCINHVRRRDAATVAMEDLGWVPSTYEGPEAQAVRAGEAESIRRAMARLSESHREILSLKHYADCSYAEIAEILDIPIGTVMSRLYNARRRLADILTSSEGETS